MSPHDPMGLGGGGAVTCAALQISNVSKTYGSTRALRSVDLSVAAGEVLALCGANGSGKSTLIKILAGVVDADPGGTLEIGGLVQDLARFGPVAARAAGLRFVHQDAGTFDGLSVAENFAVTHGYPRGRLGGIGWKALRERTARILSDLKVDATPDDLVGDLSPAVRMTIAIARAISDVEPDGGAQPVLILDEPTASLPAHEVGIVLDAIREHAANGYAIIYVSHRLDEVLAVADSLAILRDGEVEHGLPIDGIGVPELAGLMAGHEVQRHEDGGASSATRGDRPTLRVEQLSVGPVEDASFEIWPGEIVGVAGLLGSGRTEILSSVFGVLPRRAGTVRLQGEPVAFRGPGEAIRAGVAYVPEDRAAAAAFAPMSITENIVMPRLREYARGLRVRRRREAADATDLVQRFSIRAPSASALISSLSGGNQQKVILARWLSMSPRLLLLDEPTQGVDVGARAEIFRQVRSAVAQGSAALVVSSDFAELLEVCDHILVLSRGRIVADVLSHQTDLVQITALTMGAETADLTKETPV